MKYRDPLFSVHGNEGRLSIYLEENDAVLNLIEEVGNEVEPGFIEDLTIYGRTQNLKTIEGFEQYIKHCDKLQPTALRVATMSTDEALDLAQQILIIVREMKAPKVATRLEIVK